MPRTEHVGVNLLVEERESLLFEYEIAVRKGKSDPAKTAHGVTAESLFRQFLADFLPKKFGVTKGYIITSHLEYDAKHLEEWDIIIYDALESPILSIRRDKEERDVAGKRAIPIEYVRAVIEVKAALTKASVTHAVDKLIKLREYPDTFDCTNQRPRGFDHRFMTAVVFFETKVTSSAIYQSALTAFEPLFQYGDMHPLFLGGMILRAHNMPERSGTFMFQWMTDEHRDEIVGKGCEVSLPFGNGTRNHERPYMVCGGFGVNEFWGFLLDFVDFLNDTKSDNPAALSIAGNYGFKQNEDWRPLFPQGQLRAPSKRDGSSNKNSTDLKKKNRGK